MLKKELQEILDYLEYAYSGAKLLDDIEAMVRISRAIEGFKLNPQKRIQNY